MAEIGSDFDDLFEDSGDERSFDGFSICSADRQEDSDVNLEGLENEEDAQEDGRATAATAAEEDDQDEEDLSWSDQLRRVVVPEFSSAIGINFPLAENPREVDFVSAFIDDDLWDLIVLETNQDEEDLPWSDQLRRVVVPEFSSAIGINFPLAENPREVDFVSAFIDDDLWDLIVLETNRYVQQKLANSPARLANYLPVYAPRIESFYCCKYHYGYGKTS